MLSWFPQVNTWHAQLGLWTNYDNWCKVEAGGGWLIPNCTKASVFGSLVYFDNLRFQVPFLVLLSHSRYELSSILLALWRDKCALQVPSTLSIWGYGM